MIRRGRSTSRSHVLLFLVAAVVSFVSFVLCWFMPAKPLRSTVHATAPEEAGVEAGEAMGMPGVEK